MQYSGVQCTVSVPWTMWRVRTDEECEEVRTDHGLVSSDKWPDIIIGIGQPDNNNNQLDLRYYNVKLR